MAIERDKELQFILWKESGVTKAAFCRQMGIGYAIFKGRLHCSGIAQQSLVR